MVPLCQTGRMSRIEPYCTVFLFYSVKFHWLVPAFAFFVCGSPVPGFFLGCEHATQGFKLILPCKRVTCKPYPSATKLNSQSREYRCFLDDIPKRLFNLYCRLTEIKVTRFQDQIVLGYNVLHGCGVAAKVRMMNFAEGFKRGLQV